MKKLLCLFLIFILSMSIVGCNNVSSGKTAGYSNNALMLEFETKDAYGNILSQVFYNKSSNNYWLIEYTYILEDKLWMCVSQNKTIIENVDEITLGIKPSYKDTQKTFFNGDISLEHPIVLINNDIIKISVVEYLHKADWWEFGYKLKIENKIDDLLIVFIDNTTIMNNYCEPVFFTTSTESGIDYFTLAWRSEDLKASFVPYIDNIKFSIKVYSTDDFRQPALCGTTAIFKN